MIEILKMLEKDSRLTAQQIAAMLGKEQAEVEKVIAKCEAENIILGYTALIDWDRTKDETVTALIEVKIYPRGATVMTASPSASISMKR
jgi:DNA-binding Lrp family transcriptional regulator